MVNAFVKHLALFGNIWIEQFLEHPRIRPAKAVNCSAVGHHCLRRARPGCWHCHCFFIIHRIIVNIIISLYLMLLSVRSFQGLTFKIGNVKRMSPASKAGLSKMDYLISVTNDGFVIILLHYKDSLDFNLNLDQRTSSVQYDPRRDGQRDQEFRRHSSLGVWEVDTLASCFPREAIISQQDCNAKQEFKQRVWL